MKSWPLSILNLFAVQFGQFVAGKCRMLAVMGFAPGLSSTLVVEPDGSFDIVFSVQLRLPDFLPFFMFYRAHSLPKEPTK
jgi:hypothetical protein